MTDRDKLRVGILASGEGTTLQSVIDACAQGRLNAEVSVVISNNRGSGALARAIACSLACAHLSAKTHPEPQELDAAILTALRQAGVHLVLLAGYAKKLGRQTLAAFGGRLLNTHPALLPKYGGRGMFGRKVHEAVLAAGDSQTGVTIHQVDAHYDHGRIIAQTTVPVMAGDDADTLQARVQEAERRFVVQTLQTLLDAPRPSGNLDLTPFISQ